VWLGWGGIRVVGFSLLHRYHQLNILRHRVGLLFFYYHNDARSNIHKIYEFFVPFLMKNRKKWLELNEKIQIFTGK